MNDNQLDQMLDQLAQSCKPVVQAIEAKLPTTKDRYGDYMSAIAILGEKVGKPNKAVYLAIGVALQRAGANKAGVTSALRVMGHL